MGRVNRVWHKGWQRDLVVKNIKPPKPPAVLPPAAVENFLREAEVWVIVQDEHLTFENQLLVWQLRRTAPWREIVAGSTRAAQVFRIKRRVPCCAAS